MAEKRYLKGLFTDTGHIDQPEGTWRHARNMVIGSLEGTINNEGGTSLAGHLKAFKNVSYGAVTGDQNKKVIGIIRVNENKVVIFSTDVVSPAASFPRSEIGIWQDDVYRIIFNPLIDPAGAPAGKLTNDLNFKQTHPIQGTFKIDSKGDLIVYWTDDLNPPRAFNIDRQIRDSVGFPTSLKFSVLYGITPLAIDNIDILNLFPYSGPVPHIDLQVIMPSSGWSTQGAVIEGGGLLTGVYYLALAYVDDDLVATNYLTVSNPVPIVDEFDYTRPTTKHDGAKEGSQTTKAIKWEISNLNTNYKYLRPSIVRSKGDAQEVFKLNDIEFTLTTTSVIFSGLETAATGSPSEVIIDTISYDTVKTIQQLDNILYLGNTTGTQDLGYQKYANNIKLTAVTKDMDPFDTFYATVDNLEAGFSSFGPDFYGAPPSTQLVDNTKSYRYAPNIFKYKGYTRGEVYAFYIAFIMKDGSMSYAYHIPGRKDWGGETDPVTTMYGLTNGYLWNDIHEVSPIYSKIFHWVDSTNPFVGVALGVSRNMNFWQNSTEFYPNTENYEIWDEAGLIPGAAGNLGGSNVRHHHFPSNRNTNMKSIASDTCDTEISAGHTNVIEPINGEFMYKYTGPCAGPNGLCGNPVAPHDGAGADKLIFNSQSTVTGMTAAQAQLLWLGNNTFIANQDMQVQVYVNGWFNRDCCPTNGTANGSDAQPTRMWTNTNASLAVQPISGSVNPTPYVWGGATGPSIDAINGYGGCYCGNNNSADEDFNTVGWITYDLSMGEAIWVNAIYENTNSGACVAQMCNQHVLASNCSSSCNGGAYIIFRVNSSSSQAPLNELYDAKVEHKVRVLGFNLYDIKIPRSTADKVQGFRIFYAKRNHSNRTVLGQSIIIPGARKRSILGICKETLTGTDQLLTAQIMGNLSDLPEDFYDLYPFTQDPSQYITQNVNLDNVSGNILQSDVETLETFKFHDFYLLSTKNSLAPATHISLEYIVENFAWNGPQLDQPKKMITTMTQSSGPAVPNTVKETWGWDAVQNCYPKNIYSGIFIGCKYITPAVKVQPRLLAQKAKSYIIGDTIFAAEALGFGGKLFNEGGESCIVFKLMTDHGFSAFLAESYPNPADWPGAPPAPGNSFTNPLHGIYGSGGYGTAGLQNSLQYAGGPWNNNGGLRNKSLLVNLRAFKTDLYKSIDSQELVWTGYEVLGADLDNFIFEADGTFLPNTNQNTTNLFTDPADPNATGIYGGDTFICRYGLVSTLTPSNKKAAANPIRGLHYHIVESTENINFRNQESADSAYFPNEIAKTMLHDSGLTDFTHKDNIKYNNNYSEGNNIRTAFPLPLRDVIQNDFPTRAHRSVKNDTTSIIDNYRIFLANQFKDLPKNRGDLWTLASFNNLLYFHMEESLFAAQGKQTMEMKDGSEAFVGSGDIFTQDPNEMVQTDGGFGGTQSQWAALTTRFGYFFVDQRSKKVFLMTDQLKEISNLGMQNWFIKNLTFNLTSLGMGSCSADNPIAGLGLHAIYDPLYKRIVLTKRDVQATQALLDGIILGNTPSAPCTIGEIYWVESACKFRICRGCKGTSPCPGEYAYLEFSDTKYFTNAGWTISYYPELNVWGSFHDYVPYIYFNTSTDFYSFTDQYPRPVWVGAPATPLASWSGTTYGNAGIWKHNATAFHGILYQENTQNRYTDADYLTRINYHPFEFEFIHNEYKAEDALVSSINYTLETFNQENISILNHGFTSFFVYNTFQMSGENLLEYFIHTRRVGNNWKINKFRDMADIALNTTPYYMSTNSNVTGGINVGTITTSEDQDMFIYDNMFKNVNPFYLNLGKAWNLQRKFIDKWVGIRLIYNNISNNFLNLYSTDVVARKSIR
jgi:hypothetical protein